MQLLWVCTGVNPTIKYDLRTQLDFNPSDLLLKNNPTQFQLLPTLSGTQLKHNMTDILQLVSGRMACL